MIVVLIHWKVHPEQAMVNAFLNYWKGTLTIKDRTGLIGELLTEPGSESDYDWITWPLTESDAEYKSFVTVGCWSSADEFHAQVGQYFETAIGLQTFEFAPRVRTVLTPVCRRMGNGRLPVDDSHGVK